MKNFKEQMELLRSMCSIQAPSGNELPMKRFLREYINKASLGWEHQPHVIESDELQDNLILIFGKPRTAVFAHMDNIGFTVRYNNQLVKVGGPKTEDGYKLVGKDSNGEQECTLVVSEEKELSIQVDREFERGTDLSFAPNWREDEQFVQSCYMDNRLGVLNALQLCENLKDGAVVFSCWEEHGGGAVGYLGKYLYEKYGIRQALISDITWITEGVVHGKGVAISLRDSGIPRKSYKEKIIKHAIESGIDFQLEVEGSGGSDGNELQKSPYPWDWCFVGAAEDFVHTPDEKVNKEDIRSMFEMYRYLMKAL